MDKKTRRALRGARRVPAELWWQTYIAPVICKVRGHVPRQKMSCTICHRCRKVI